MQHIGLNGNMSDKFSYPPSFTPDIEFDLDDIIREANKAIDDLDKEKECECGAEKTRNPNCHSNWCPKYKK